MSETNHNPKMVATPTVMTAAKWTEVEMKEMMMLMGRVKTAETIGPEEKVRLAMANKLMPVTGGWVTAKFLANVMMAMKEASQTIKEETK